MALVHLGGDRWRVFVEAGVDERTGRRVRPSRIIYATGVKDARRQARPIEDELRSVDQRAHTMTLARCVDEWWALHGPTRQESTRRGYQRLIDARVKTHKLAKKRLLDVTRADIRRWYAELEAEGHAATAPKLRAILRPALRYAVDARYVRENVADDQKMPEHRTPKWRRSFPEEVCAVIAAAAAVHPVRGRVLHCAAQTGMRRGELCGLRWPKVDFIEAYVTVDRAVAIGVDYKLVEKGTKTDDERVLSIDHDTVCVLMDQDEWQRDEQPRRAEDVYVWSVRPPFGEPLHPDTLTNWFTRARKDAGVGPMRLHDLRHWHASGEAALVRQVPGASLADVQRRLGHRQMATTYRYLHPDEDDAIDRRFTALRPSLRALPPADEVDDDARASDLRVRDDATP